MAFQIKKASKLQAWLRMGVSGPAGAGKTFTSLKIASEMGDGRIVVIDTQRGQANHYGNQFEFDVLELADHHPQNFIDALNHCAQQGYKYIIIDSITHEWTGKNGCLELHYEAVARQKTKNTFAAWKDITPLHTRFFESINSVPAHVIATMRSKVDHVQDKDESGRNQVRKVGMATIQREGSDYELDVLLEMEIDHTGVITKCRDGESTMNKLDGRVFKKPGKDLAQALNAWLSDGEPAPAPLPPEPEQESVIIAALHEHFVNKGKTEAEWLAYLNSNVRKLNEQQQKNLLTNWMKLEEAQAESTAA